MLDAPTRNLTANFITSMTASSFIDLHAAPEAILDICLHWLDFEPFPLAPHLFFHLLLQNFFPACPCGHFIGIRASAMSICFSVFFLIFSSTSTCCNFSLSSRHFNDDTTAPMIHSHDCFSCARAPFCDDMNATT